MERDLLLMALVAEVLGPRGGPHEHLGAHEDPLDEYLTGVLAPHEKASLDLDADAELERESGSAADDHADPGNGAFSPQAIDHLLCPALDPRARPASLGLSFTLAAETEHPVIDICCSWGRYLKTQQGDWERTPRGEVLNDVAITGLPTTHRALQDSHVEIHVRSRLDPSGWRVTVFLVNSTNATSDRPTTEEHIFQPQIRIRLHSGTVALPLDDGRSATTEEDQLLSLLYSKRQSYARGHLCAAVWAEIDSERPHPSLPAVTAEPFWWADGDAVFGPKERIRFSPADIRSAYVPVVQVQSPDREWDTTFPKPELDPLVLAEAWDPACIRQILSPLTAAYGEWIRQLEATLPDVAEHQREIAHTSISRCRSTLARIQAGIDLLVTDDDARLAFAFANQAMAIQSRWTRGHVNRWFPFQIAFQLMNLPAIVDRTHPDRAICDLLWFPTGGGKTEAYLGLAAFTMAHRRLRARRTGDRIGGAGVTILSRYTLRLLTIQQFRRALALVTACELLRVDQSAARTTGWRPKACADSTDALWGDTRFSAGLWVGGGVTPNNLQSFEYVNGQGRRVRVLGAIEILEGNGGGDGEPAQVLSCPACNSHLALPPDGFPAGHKVTLHIVLRDAGHPPTPTTNSQLSHGVIIVSDNRLHTHTDKTFSTLTVVFKGTKDLSLKTVEEWCSDHVIPAMGPHTSLVAASIGRPGYFIRTADWGGSEKPIDFEIHCPNPGCDLNTRGEWREMTSTGATPVPDAFSTGRGTSTHCPIPAWTVDDQIYSRCPSIVIATVDKFARLAFEPRAAALFGNVDQCNEHLGYYRQGCPPDGPSGPPTRPRQHVLRGRNVAAARFAPPELILQDELHLIEGPLGSMVGLYETAVDQLASTLEVGQVVRTKYIASTATVRQASEQVQSLFIRDLEVFPPSGLSVDDAFFSRVVPSHPRDSTSPGRLYVGVCAPGRGAQTPIRNIWARLLQHVADRLAGGATPSQLDPFWTLVGYFNAIRELAGAVALVRQDIPQRLGDLSAAPRPLTEEDPLELSSRADSLRLPGMLDLLRLNLQGAQPPMNAVVATSMFGTGVDVDRLGLMVVHGQPKTSSSYIQATGRVGRSGGGLVVTFLRASRPRDLNHYEFFSKYHIALYRHVEPVTVNPFSPRARDRALGPVAVALLRQAESIVKPGGATAVHERWRAQQRLSAGWHCRAGDMATQRSSPEVLALPGVTETRAQQQPPARRPGLSVTSNDTDAEIDCWQSLATRVGGNLVYTEPTLVNAPRCPVVLGDLAHLVARTGLAYEESPNSLREVESTTTFRGWSIPLGRRNQEIRPSQFVISYGPGTILETRSGPVVMLSMDAMFRNINKLPSDFEIIDPRLCQAELGGGRIARLPTNDELQVPVDDPIYPTERLPFWSLCTRHTPQVLYQSDKGCPDCQGLPRGESLAKAGREAIRFVLACEAGHLDELDWSFVVHGRRSTCRPKGFNWHGGGRALRHVELECRECGMRVNMGKAYGQRWPCRCRMPETGPAPQDQRCGVHGGYSGRMMQRGAANLRMPVTVAALTIMDMPSRLHNVLSDVRILTTAHTLRSVSQLNQQSLMTALANVIPPVTLSFLQTVPWMTLDTSLQQMLQWNGTGGTSRSLLEEEFERLERAASHGAPAVPSAHPGGAPLFEVCRADVRYFRGPSGRVRFRVTPVSRLRMVFVQKGYQRIDPQLGQEVSSSFKSVNDTWYPGVALYGEGIFLDLDGIPLPLTGQRNAEWQARYESESGANPRLHPVHVWWHTLAHRLLQAFAIDSGYSSAAIRERIYLQHSGGITRGGLMLYTVQPGGDGTLGGLIALVPRFAQVLASALQDLAVCSNDPLCERSPSLGAEGAACYSCLLASETSCEHRNLGLDRLLLLGNLP